MYVRNIICKMATILSQPQCVTQTKTAEGIEVGLYAGLHSPEWVGGLVPRVDKSTVVSTRENTRVNIYVLRHGVLNMFVPDGPNDRWSALVQISDWHQTRNKPIPDPKWLEFTNAYMHHQTETCERKFFFYQSRKKISVAFPRIFAVFSIVQ